MRKSMNLALATALAAAAFGGVAAAQQQAAGCDNPDEQDVAVVKIGEPFKTEQGVGPLPGGTGIAYVYTYLLDLGAMDKADLTATITWDTGYDYDLYFAYEVNGERTVSDGSYGDQMIAGEDSVETASLENIPNCALLKIGADNYIGDPTELVNLTVEYS